MQLRGEYGEGYFKARSGRGPEARGRWQAAADPYAGQRRDRGCIEFLQISAKQDIKAVAYMAQKPGDDGKMMEQPVVAFLRGDHTVNETKLLTLVKASQVSSHADREVELCFQGPRLHWPIGLVVKPKEALPGGM